MDMGGKKVEDEGLESWGDECLIRHGIIRGGRGSTSVQTCSNLLPKILTERPTPTRFMTKIPYTAVDFDYDL